MSDQKAELPHDETSLEKAVEDNGFDQGYIEDGIDHSLFTIGEMKLLGNLQKEHEQTIEKRAAELRFSPEIGLSERERAATVRCLTYKEIEPIMTCRAIYLKGERMTKELSPEEKVDVRIFSRFTLHFSELGPGFERVRYEDVFVWAQLYRKIMKKHDLPLFEELYAFLRKEEKKSVLEAGSRLSPEEYMTDEEYEEAEKRKKALESPAIAMGEGAIKDDIVLSELK